jgi:D-alanyl-D-alanine carboxypeptidase
MCYRKELWLLGCLVLVLCTACGGGGNSGAAADGSPTKCPAPAASNSPSGSLGSIVDGVVASEMQTQGLPGMTVAVAKDGSVLYTQGYGYSDLGTCQPIQANAELQIGSVTKQFTAAAILQLQQAGLLDIDKTVVTYLPNYAFDSRITLRMLLNQTSGLQDYVGFPSLQQYIGGVQQSVVLDAIVQAPLLFSPGAAFNYSNSNYFILGSIIEAVTSQSYPDYLTAHILLPAGLVSTFYVRPSASASPYEPGAGGAPVPGRIPDSSVFFAAGALWSNVQDLALWDAALRNGKVIPESLFALMVTPAAVSAFQQSGVPSEYGMGWVRGGTPAGHQFVWHNGQTVSYTAFNGLFLDDGFSITVLTNYPVQENAPLLSFAQTLIQAICNNSATADRC